MAVRMNTVVTGRRLLPLAVLLAACRVPATPPVPSAVPSTPSPSPFFDDSLGLPASSSAQGSATPSLISAVTSPIGPTRTPPSGVLDFNPLDAILLPNEIRGPFEFTRPSLAGNPNSDVLEARGQEEGAQYIASTGRIDGARAEFTSDLNDPSSFLTFSVHMIIFQSHAGPAFLFTEKGGACRPEQTPNFPLIYPDLGIGDISVLCSDGMQYWLRVAYRNVYFDISALGTPSVLQGELLTQIATAQLMKLEAFPVVDSVTIPPTQTLTPSWTPTPPGTPEVFPTPSPGPSWITEADNGKAFFYYPTIRFGLDLNPTRYLKRDLDISECDFLGEVSNWSLNGPDSLPVGFEATETGECTIRIRDFRVHIVIVDWP